MHAAAPEMHWLSSSGSLKGRRKITIPANLDYQGVFDPVLNEYTNFHKLRRVKTTNFGTLFELIYAVDVNEDMDQKKFIDELRALNGNMTINLVFFKYDDKIYET